MTESSHQRPRGRRPSRRRTRAGLTAWLASSVLAWVLASASAEAAFPGLNGAILFFKFDDGLRQIFAIEEDGTGETRLSDGTQEEFSPRLSADGSRIAFVSGIGIATEISVMNADGSGKLQLTSNANVDITPAWSPDGGRIVFSSDRNGDFDLHVMNADGTGVTSLTSGAPTDFDPVWSPDGRRIAFSRHLPSGQTEVFVLDLQTMDLTNLTQHPASDRASEWSPDGRQLAFVSDRDGDLEVYVMNADGTEVRQLTVNEYRDNVPAWSPDGSLIAFSSDRADPGGSFALYVMSAVDGGGVRRLTPTRGDDPSWQAIPPALAIEELLDSVQQLIDAGAVIGGQGNALASTLEAAVSRLDQDDVAAAIQQLRAFISQVEAFIASGALTEAEGRPLIQGAREVIDFLTGI